MHGSKLLRLFQLLDPEAVKRLLSFVQSPFFNTNPHLVKLYRLLRSDYPDLSAPKLKKERVFAKLWPNRDYDHQKLLNLTSDFTRLIKQYLQVLQLEKDERAQEKLLLEALAERPQHYDIFRKETNRAEKRLKRSSYRDADFYRRRYWVRQLLLNHPGTDKFQTAKTEYDRTMGDLDRAYQLEKLLLSCEMKAREKPLSEHYDIWLLDAIRKHAQANGHENPVQRAYHQMLELLESGSPTAYLSLKTALFDHPGRFTRRQQQDILQSLVNFAIQQGNRGHQSYVEENLELYQFGLQKELFLEHGLLNDMTFINVVNIALRASARGWCLDFINEYEFHLDTVTRKDAKSLATALCLYDGRRPNETITLLRRVDFLNVYYQIQARVLLIKVYCENLEEDRSYYDLVCSQSDSFERYLRRNKKISRDQRTALMHFCTSTKRLAKLKTFKTYGQREILAEFKQEITDLGQLYNRSWFLQQLQ